ncbi:hypothetical protein H5410_052396 [Solanum commersonii]|uniref:Uncharacterized protein n=1 Tax=Solanum commersonii TaxID=4109 RepID=A0A9J5X0Q6_SOLCO|nr:hypothetical protein H5410_052396 [Solanum commersonii]
MYTTRLTLLMQRSIVHSKIQVVTHHYQRISCSQYLLKMQVQAQQKCSNALTQRKIPYSHNGSQFKVLDSNAMLTLTQDQKGFFKACNGAECKCMAFGLSWLFNQPRFMRIKGSGSRKVMLSSSFFQRKVRFNGCSHTHRVGHKRGICQIGSHSSNLPKIISRDSLT